MTSHQIPGALARAFEERGLFTAGRLRAHAHVRRPLEETVTAHAGIEPRANRGKVVLRPV
ncbi:hypothetical protein ACFWAT_18970 [Streptomyces syringium]|uniref:hypothetical protein n=1 Tax=Streptomyces syringium TaxID=76729 RepID=UPI003650422E